MALRHPVKDDGELLAHFPVGVCDAHVRVRVGADDPGYPHVEAGLLLELADRALGEAFAEFEGAARERPIPAVPSLEHEDVSLALNGDRCGGDNRVGGRRIGSVGVVHARRRQGRGQPRLDIRAGGDDVLIVRGGNFDEEDLRPPLRALRVCRPGFDDVEIARTELMLLAGVRVQVLRPPGQHVLVLGGLRMKVRLLARIVGIGRNPDFKIVRVVVRDRLWPREVARQVLARHVLQRLPNLA